MNEGMYSCILDVYRKVSWSCDLKGRRPHPSHKGPLGGPQILTGTVQPSSQQLVGRTGSGWFLNARSLLAYPQWLSCPIITAIVGRVRCTESVVSKVAGIAERA